LKVRGEFAFASDLWLDDEEIAILARTGATVSHNPVSNLKLASGIARVPDLLAAGVRVTLGTDGAISGNDLDMWLALRLAATLHKGARQDAGAVTTGQALAMVTRDAADALGAGDRIGSLEPGKLADLALWRVDGIGHAGIADPVTALVFGSAPPLALLTVGGRTVVERDELRTADEGALAAALGHASGGALLPARGVSHGPSGWLHPGMRLPSRGPWVRCLCKSRGTAPMWSAGLQSRSTSPHPWG
jgi:5-methylthioadenosine/S-adenosylhomocysteine deaminase